jgi:putative ABC transport system permease protein
MLVICLALIIGPLISTLFIQVLAKLPVMQRAPLPWQLALRSMYRRPLLTGLVVMSMSLSFGVFHSIHQLQQAITKDLIGGATSGVNASKVPTFFLMDMPSQYKNDIVELAHTNNAKLVDLSHHLRGRLATINGEIVGQKRSIFFWQKSKEAEDKQRLQRHQLGLTFRSNLVEDEIILEGQSIDTLPNNEIHASIEKRYAQRMGIDIGDVLEFDIFGKIIKARVANFRQVRWLNFRPNFFVVLSPQALGDLPFTYLGAVVVDEVEGVDHKQQFLQQLRKKIPGVSAIDVQRGLFQVNKLVAVIAGMLKTLALFLPIGACLMLFGLAIYQRQEKKIDQQTLQLLGMKKSSLRLISLAQYAFIGPVSTIVAYLLGAGLLMTVMIMLVDLPIWAWAWSTILNLIVPYTLGLGFFI